MTSELAKKYNIIASKKYGQNFLFDSNICDKIVRFASINKHSHVLEIGPGTGGLTFPILKKSPKSFTVIEVDTQFMPILEEIKSDYSEMVIINQDALKIKLSSISTGKLDIISNLPYNIGTILLTSWMKQISSVNSMTLMLQKEVVDRITASVSTKSYGRLSVIPQLICDIKKCFEISPGSFVPRPKILSAIVRLTPSNKRNLEANILSKIEKITQFAFSSRRKMIKSSLKRVVSVEQLKTMNIDPTKRAENLSPAEYLDIAVKS